MALPFAVTLQTKTRKRSPHQAAKLSHQMQLIQARALAVSAVTKRRKKRRLPKRLQRQQQPDHIRRQYRAALLAFFEHAHRITRAALQEAKDAIEREAAGHRTDASAVQIFTKTARDFYDAFPNTQLAKVARTFADLTSDYQKSQIVEQFKAAVGINIFAGITEDWLPGAVDSFVTENVSLIRTLAQDHFDDLRSHLTEAITEGWRWEEIASELEDRYGIADRHAELIARDQVGKFYGALNEERQTEIGVQKYAWRTARDNRVRDEHVLREGVEFSWDDPPEDGHPGEAINCRCEAQPDVTGLLEDLG